MKWDEYTTDPLAALAQVWSQACALCVPGVVLAVLVTFPCAVWGDAQKSASDSEVASAKTALRVTKIGPELYRCGNVRLDASKRCLRFPAKVNRWDGPLEYALVNPSGAKHESLLVTDVDPVDIHTAAALLGAASPSLAGVESSLSQKPSGSDFASPPSGPLDSQSLKSAPEPAGKAVQIWVEFMENGHVRRERLESWLEWSSDADSAKRLRIPDTHWVYTGSYVFNGQFAAKDEGNLIALVISSAALVNNPLPQNRNDRSWGPRSSVIPVEGTAIEIELVFEPLRVERR